MTFMRNIVWTLSNLCRNKNPPPPFELIKPVLPVFNRLLNYTDQDVLGKIFMFYLLSFYVLCNLF